MRLSLANGQTAIASRKPAMSLLDRLLLWQSRAMERQQLQSLSDHDLKDVGLTRADVDAEAGKPFWRP